MRPNREDSVGWGGRIRTCECRYQKPVPYHLATPQQARARPYRPGGGRGRGGGGEIGGLGGRPLLPREFRGRTSIALSSRKLAAARPRAWTRPFSHCATSG